MSCFRAHNIHDRFSSLVGLGIIAQGQVESTQGESFLILNINNELKVKPLRRLSRNQLKLKDNNVLKARVNNKLG